MSARYTFSNSYHSQRLREGLQMLREGRQKLLDTVGVLQQMSDTQITTEFSFSDGVNAADNTVAAAAKSELISDVGKLAVGDSAGAAIQQMLDQFD